MNLSKENGETQQANINDENMQNLNNQQPSEEDTVEPEDFSYDPTEKCEGRKIRSWYLPFQYQDAAKKLSPRVGKEYSDVYKRRVISKFADKSTEKSAYGTEKFRRDTLIVELDKLILDLKEEAKYLQNIPRAPKGHGQALRTPHEAAILIV
ncbi:uncharacterized protein TNCV_700491 [Trichonephila clavipes]|nr:uncharacterized protein TNCV_700491 [Trichonephila clavipes]